MILRTLLSRSLLMAALVLLVNPGWAAPEPAEVDDGKYVPPAGAAAPVAPPLQKGSPLDHLANDPKLETPTVGYREGKTSGSVTYTAHRLVDPVGGQGWGWVKKSADGWGSATWIAVQETPGSVVAPHRKLLKADGDVNWEYKFWGRFAGYQAYDPRLDETLPVFILEGYEVIGPANPLSIKIGPSGRVFQKRSGASSRASSPIQSDPGID